MKIVNLTQNTPEWLAWRSTGIGASDIATILDLNPSKTQYELWAEKTGYRQAPDLSNNPMVNKGNRLEPVARKRIEEAWADTLTVFCAEHDEFSQLKVSFDGVDSYGCPHEIKCPTDAVFAEVEMFGESSEAYLLYQHQVRYQCTIAGQSKGYLHFFSVAKDALITFEIKLSTEDAKNLIASSLDFWKLIETNQAPEMDKKRDKVDASQIDKPSLIQSLLDSKLVLAKAEAKFNELKAGHAELEGKFVEQLGEFDRFEDKAFGLKITKYETKGRVNYSRFIKDNNLDTEVENYRGKPSNSVRFTYTEASK